ncbi:hypothetical protein LP7551_02793 [Roseibium album]|nr:hypothetical protein LP7551_02793 [Roseibium album]
MRASFNVACAQRATRSCPAHLARQKRTRKLTKTKEGKPPRPKFHALPANRACNADGWLPNSLISLEQTFNLPLIIEPDLIGRRHARQAGHGHDFTADDDNETCTGREPDFPDR